MGGNLSQILMRVKLCRMELNGVYRDIRAMVGNALIVGEQIRKHKADLYSTFAVLQTLNMTVFKLVAQLVYNLLKRLNVLCGNGVVVDERINRKVEYFADSVGQNL